LRVSTIASLERAQPLWPVSAPALVAAQACVGAAARAEAAVAAASVREERAFLVAGLAGLGVRVVGPAEGPFVLIRVPDAMGVRSRLRERGFAVRRADTFPGLGPTWLRVAVRDRATTTDFLRALSQSMPTDPPSRGDVPSPA
jgi:histidinol-phosphate aminotransferase